ncbi:hypothetical protein MLD38_006939 [Melastoma candidum]|uniref:Uncharacterized protein n=1 Tax=Melastoma candidum TaxID=119954 RepID=A0ACB9RNQ4_9MYRT|nr:hypothetical protein MLD38_006939 [Melastoma candidum]
MLHLKPFPSSAFRLPRTAIPAPSFFVPSLIRTRSPTILRMSAAAGPAATSRGQIVEHVVLFKVKPNTPPSSVINMLSSLNGLTTTIPSVLHLSAAPVIRTNSPYTHLLHSRYPSQAALADYSAHPNHVEVVRGAVIPICEDMMAVDWVSIDPASVESPAIAPGKAVKITFLKLKEELGEGEGKGVVLDAISGMKGKVKGGLEAVSFGENFSPARAKGFGIGSVAVFSGKEEMETADKEEVVGAEKEKVRGLLEEVIVVDFVVPEKEKVASL